MKNYEVIDQFFAAQVACNESEETLKALRPQVEEAVQALIAERGLGKAFTSAGRNPTPGRRTPTRRSPLTRITRSTCSNSPCRSRLPRNSRTCVPMSSAPPRSSPKPIPTAIPSSTPSVSRSAKKKKADKRKEAKEN